VIWESGTIFSFEPRSVALTEASSLLGTHCMVWIVGPSTFTETGPEAASRSELGKCLQFQLLTRPQQEDQSLTCLGNIASSHLKNKNKLTKKQWGQTSAVMPSDSQTTRLSHVVKKAQATGMRAPVCPVLASVSRESSSCSCDEVLAHVYICVWLAQVRLCMKMSSWTSWGDVLTWPRLCLQQFS
jgi:hypothetical protein